MYIVLGLTKISVMLLYRRIFLGKVFNRYSTAVVIMLLGWLAGFFFARLFQCGLHVQTYWTLPELRQKYCIDTNALAQAWAISDVLTDILVLTTPIPMILKLQMSGLRKSGLCAIFLLGTLYVISHCNTVYSLADVIPKTRSTVAGFVRLAIVFTDFASMGPGKLRWSTQKIWH